MSHQESVFSESSGICPFRALTNLHRSALQTPYSVNTCQADKSADGVHAALAGLRRQTELPVIFTVRSAAEGGGFTGDAAAQVRTQPRMRGCLSDAFYYV